MTDIEARREARRRRILENAGKRLQKITGVEERNASPELEGYRSLNNDSCYSESTIHASHSIADPVSTSRSNEDLLYLDRTSERSPTTSPSIGSDSKLILNNLLSHRTPIIILIAFCVNVFLYLFENHQSSFVNRIFIPLLCFEALDILYNPKEASSTFAKYLILFRNVPQQRLVLLIKYLGLIKAILRDVLIYFFVFVCILYLRSLLTKETKIGFDL